MRVLYLALLLLTACPFGKQQKVAKVIKAEYSNSWHGATRLQAAKSIYVTSPVDGYVTSLGLGFGRLVQAGDSLLTISAPAIQEDFASAIIEYLRNKEKLEHESKKLKGEGELLAAGILSEEEYWGQKSSNQDAFIAFIKSKIHLQELAKLVNIDFAKLANLDVADQASVVKLMSEKVKVSVIANAKGLLLPNNLDNTPESKPLTLGAKIEKGAILAAIAAQGSYKIQVLMPEKYSRLMSAKATVMVSTDLGVRIPAKLTDYQPYSIQEKSGNRYFPISAELIMPKPPSQVPELYIGMPVKVEVVLGHADSLVVPIAAIGFANDKYYVDKTGHFSNARVEVEVLATDVSKAYIKAKLNPGDQVLLHD